MTAANWISASDEGVLNHLCSFLGYKRLYRIDAQSTALLLDIKLTEFQAAIIRLTAYGVLIKEDNLYRLNADFDEKQILIARMNAANIRVVAVA